MAVQAEIKWRDTVVASLDRVDVGSASEFRGNINNNTTQVAEAFNTISKEYVTQVDNELQMLKDQGDAELASIIAQGDTEVKEVETAGQVQVHTVEKLAGTKINLIFAGTEAEKEAYIQTLDPDLKVYVWIDTADGTTTTTETDSTSDETII